MAKILSFKGKNDTSAGQTFLTDDTDKLSFHTGEDGVVSLNDVPSETLPTLFADPKKDWTNQELADLFRVRRLLSGANVPVETMHGVTDEGDPWFVFCHFNGDVFIHMARIDGIYVLDSPNVRRPLRGNNFNALIADFTDDALPSHGSAGDTDEGATARVVRLERNGKVRLHPSAMLAALIWTLFMASEELVMLAPEEETAGADDLLDFTNIISADADFAAIEAPGDDLNAPSAADDFKIDHAETIHTADATQDGAQGQMREVMGQQGVAMQQNAYAMGLSTIAIAMGFMTEVVLMDNQHKVLEGLKTLGIAQADADATNGPELEQIVSTSSDALMQKLADFLGLDLSLNTDVAEAPVAGPSKVSMLQQDMLHVSTEAVVEAEALVPPKATQKLASKTDDAESDMPQDPAQDLAQTPSETDAMILMAAAQQQGTAAFATDLITGSVQLEAFQLGQTTVMANFDLNNARASSLMDYLAFDTVSGHQAFDARVQSFLDHLNGKDEVGIITMGNEVIMIDRAVFLTAGEDTCSYSWETWHLVLSMSRECEAWQGIFDSGLSRNAIGCCAVPTGTQALSPRTPRA